MRTDGEPGRSECSPRYRTNSSSLRRASRTYCETSTMILLQLRALRRSTGLSGAASMSTKVQSIAYAVPHFDAFGLWGAVHDNCRRVPKRKCSAAGPQHLYCCNAIYAPGLGGGVLCWRAIAPDASAMNRKPATLAYWSLKHPALGPRLLGSSIGGRRPENANRLLTGDSETVDIIQHMEPVCD